MWPQRAPQHSPGARQATAAAQTFPFATTPVWGSAAVLCGRPALRSRAAQTNVDVAKRPAPNLPPEAVLVSHAQLHLARAGRGGWGGEKDEEMGVGVESSRLDFDSRSPSLDLSLLPTTGAAEMRFKL